MAKKTQGHALLGMLEQTRRSVTGLALRRLGVRSLDFPVTPRDVSAAWVERVLRERVRDWFDLPEGHESPYMLLVAPVAEDRLLAPDAEAQARTGLERLDTKRSELPAITHVDNSARVQTVDPDRSPRYYKLLRAFEERTGCPVLINTSFNVRGEPIVCTPADAWRCFLATDMDVLVLEDLVLEKEDQPSSLIPSREDYLEQFALD